MGKQYLDLKNNLVEDLQSKLENLHLAHYGTRLLQATSPRALVAPTVPTLPAFTGSSLPTMNRVVLPTTAVRCTGCGSILADDAEFCGKCGKARSTLGLINSPRVRGL